jgi:hypothetical protein
MPLLCMYVLCSLVLICQVLVVLSGVFQSLVGHSGVSPLPLLEGLGLLPFRRPELGFYCAWCASFDHIFQ